MKVLDAAFTKAFCRLCFDGWEKGWHERNGGNLSYRIKEEEIQPVLRDLKEVGEWTEIGVSVPELGGEYFMVTGSGKFFRNVTSDPEANICIIKLDERGERYRILWGLKDGGRPTSELPSHLMNLAVIKKRKEELRVVYHGHPTNIIALTFVLPLEGRVFTRELWEMATECPVVFPEGVGVVPWMVPGGREIAEETAKIMSGQDVAIWAHHGMFVCGTDFDTAFGLMHTVEKAAEVLVKVLSMTNQKRQTITPEEFRKLNEPFQIRINEEFLFEKEEGEKIGGDGG